MRASLLRRSLPLAVLLACGGTEPAPAASPAASPAAAPTADAADRPDVDGEIARIDLTDPDLRPQPGTWTMVSSTLSDNDCGVDPRKAPDGPCTMGCGSATIKAVEPGVFTLETPAIGYAGTCVLLDGGARFTCKGGTTMAPAETTLGGSFSDAGVVDGSWTLVMGEDGPKPGCRMSGAFRAEPPVG